MTIEISTALKNSMLSGEFKSKREVNSATLSLGDGDGTGGMDTINDSAGGLDVLSVGSFVTILTLDPDPNRNKTVKVLSSSATKLEVMAGSLTAFSAGTRFNLVEPDIFGSFASIFRNGTIHLFTESKLSSADLAEPGVPVCKITLNKGAFTPSVPENGLNFGDIVDSILRRAIDPATGNQEIWNGDPLSDGIIRSGICYSNNLITGASIASHRFAFSVTGPNGGGDAEISPSNTVAVGTPVNIGTVRVELKATALL